MLVERGRLDLDMTAGAFRTLVLRHGIHEEPLDGEIGIAAAELPDTHADPADRMIVATAVLRRDDAHHCGRGVAELEAARLPYPGRNVMTSGADDTA